MTYSWKFKEGALETIPSLNGRDDVVVVINYERVGTNDKGNEFSLSGQLVCPEPSPIEFIAHADLLEEDICKWLDALVDTTIIDEAIKKELLRTKTVTLPLPWADKK